MAGKNIVICCDGTSNHPGQVVDGKLAPTNVSLFHGAIADQTASGWTQVTWYDPGVGTGTSTVSKRATRLARLARWVVSALPGWFPDIVNRMLKVLEAATGASIEENIEQGYREIVRQYEPGDRIFLVGFSRGAYTARCIAGVIARCGLLRREHIRFVAEVITLYRRRTGASPTPLVDAKYVHAGPPRVHALALWDTVASLGLPLWGWWFRIGALWRNLPLDTDPAPVCEHVYHALSMDERRSMFFPTMVSPAKGIGVEQMWFRGAHADVGGGYAEPELAGVSLAWMLGTLSAQGLRLGTPASPPTRPAPNPLGVAHDELERQPGWQAFGSWPRWHPISRPGDRTPAAVALAERFGRLDSSVWARAAHAGRSWHARLAAAGAGAVPEVDARVAADGFVFLDVGDTVAAAVPADRQWTRTGVVIEQGAAYRLTAKGAWRDADKPACGPEGQDSAGIDAVRRLFARVKRRRTGRWMELFGHVAHSRPWPLFELGFFMLLKFLLLRDPAPLVLSLLRLGQHMAAGGAVYLHQQGASGVFHAFPNDCWETYANNSGQVIVEIERVAQIPAGVPWLTVHERGDVEEMTRLTQAVSFPIVPGLPPVRGTLFGVPIDAPRAAIPAGVAPAALAAPLTAVPRAIWKRSDL